jgi:adenosylcobyric acid synthase
MLGDRIVDPEGVEGAPGADVTGLGLLDARTTFREDKVLRLSSGTALGHPVTGYEIHHGVLELGEVEAFPGGGVVDGVFATMWHGSLESDGFRQAFLVEVAARVGRTWRASDVVFAERREARLELLGDLVEEHLDVHALLDLARSGPPQGLLVLPPGSSRRR